MTASETPCIQFKDVHKSFGDQKVLAGVDLELPRGKLSVILGPSGTGKSVLLKHILGLLQPDRGQVLIDGVDPWSLSEKDRNEFRKKFGMLFQNAALFDSLTVEENVAFPLKEHTRLSREEIHAKVLERLQDVGLTEALEKMPAELSGGMRKRVGLARALALIPAIVLYDEPTTGLDPLMTDTINRLIEETQRKLDITSVVISHDIESTFQIAGFVAMLHEGRIIAQGSPDEIRRNPHPFVKKFLGQRGVV